MSEALEALEAALTDVLDEIEHSRKADAMEETLALYQLRGFAQTRLELALGDLDTLRAALSAEPVDDRIGKWLSAALEDSSTCAEMRADIEAWFASRAAKET
jgi:hypothetical protein